MIDLKELVFALNEYLGRDKYILYLGTNGFPSKEESRIVCTVNIGQVPYAFSTAEIDATSLNCTFTFELPCATYEDEYKRDNALQDIAEKLITWKKILIRYPDGTKYALNTFFEMMPLGQPYVDCGKVTQQAIFAGKALLQNINCGAVIGNNETVEIDGEKVLVIDKISGTDITYESNMALSKNSYVPELTAIAYANTLKLTCLYMGTNADNAFWQIGEGTIENPNKIYKIVTRLTNINGEDVGAWARKVKLASVNNISSAGVFNRYEVVFQYVGKATVEEEE